MNKVLKQVVIRLVINLYMYIQALKIKLRASLWFMPMLLVAGAILLAYVCLTIDQAAPLDFAHYYPQPFAGGADSIRMMLSAIATSMITVSGITFSLTISSLAQVAGQLTARVLRNFMSNLTNKLVLGFFVGLFAYCIVVIRTIRLKDDAAGAFIPALSVFVAMGLAIAGIGVLIYFIHFVALSIQASTVVSSVAEEALVVLEKLYPHRLAQDAQEDVMTPLPVGESRSVQAISSHKNGYVQLIDEQKLRQFAQKHGCLLRVEAGTGDFVTTQSPLVSLIDLAQPVDSLNRQEINRAFSLQATRTIEHEIAFGIRQLVDMALKALAPAASDTTTAVLVLDYLSAILVELVQRQLQPHSVSLSFVPKQPTFANLLSEALDQIRDQASGNTVVLTRLLFLLQTVGRPTTNFSRRSVLVYHTRLVTEQAAATLPSAHQLTLIRQQLRETLSTLNEPGDAILDLL